MQQPSSIYSIPTAPCLDFLLLWYKLMVGFHHHLVDYV